MAKNMSREEFLLKYGNVEVEFKSYNKFTFTFEGKLADGRTIIVDVGGDPDDMYRVNITAGVLESIHRLHPYAGWVFYEGKEKESFYGF